MTTIKVTVLLLCLSVLWHDATARHPQQILPAKGNGILSCRPGVEFPRDCGNRCRCADNGLSATCTEISCPTNHREFDEANRQVYKELDIIRGQGSGPVFQCEPYTERKVNDGNGTCYCAKSGHAEICSNRIGDPWGLKP
ncbi:hypothetical protein R5R35_012514 [Gryllus longicercus]|uniref:Pacifastin domain-containing protein n=1 Tax=Gryllus longicercus TaxID=2509291 RepID=A0AAN9Z1H4_9ORTH